MSDRRLCAPLHDPPLLECARRPMHFPTSSLSFLGKRLTELFSYTELERTAGNLAGRSLHRAYRVNCTDQIRTSRERYPDEVRAHDSNAGKSRQRMGESKRASDGGRPMR
jgi:hypothetical protein